MDSHHEGTNANHLPKDTLAQGYHAALAIDLVAYVDEKFHTINHRRYHGVFGFSVSGYIWQSEHIERRDCFSRRRNLRRLDRFHFSGQLAPRQN